MVLELRLTQREVAKRLSIPAGSIGSWFGVAKAKRRSSEPGAPTVGESAAENALLCKEPSEARIVREILGRAIADFSKEPQRGMR